MNDRLVDKNGESSHTHWAGTIKSQHRYLKQLFDKAQCVKCDDSIGVGGEKCSTNNRVQKNNLLDSHTCVLGQIEDSSFTRCYHCEIIEWQRIINNPAHSLRMKDYASAMFLLANHYWKSQNDMSKSEDVLCTTQLKSGNSVSTSTSLAFSHYVPEQNLNTNRVDTTGSNSGSAAYLSLKVRSDHVHRRQYDDRIEYTLESIQEYFIGLNNVKARAKNCKVTTTRSNESYLAVGKSFSDQIDSSDGKSINSQRKCLVSLKPYGLIFRQKLKTMRQQFFAQHKRTASISEVETMLSEIYNTYHVCHNKCGIGRNIITFSSYRNAWQLAAFVACSHCYSSSLSENYISKRRRCGCDSVVDEYRPCLHVLDVGSCYNPFFGQRLSPPMHSGKSALPNIPLLITALDLQPYDEIRTSNQDDIGVCHTPVYSSCNGNRTIDRYGKVYQPNRSEVELCGKNIVNHFDYPFTWKGDWLSLSFFEWHKPHNCGECEERKGTQCKNCHQSDYTTSSARSTVISDPATNTSIKSMVDDHVSDIHHPNSGACSTTSHLVSRAHSSGSLCNACQNAEERDTYFLDNRRAVLTRSSYTTDVASMAEQLMRGKDGLTENDVDAESSINRSEGDEMSVKHRSHHFISPKSLEIKEVALGSYDVVIFSLLLSYIPSPRLRYLACLHALLALQDGGFFIVISTRTQGARNGAWIKNWVRCICSIGFTRTHQRIMENLVILTFAKNVTSSVLAKEYCTHAEQPNEFDNSLVYTRCKEISLNDHNNEHCCKYCSDINAGRIQADTYGSMPNTRRLPTNSSWWEKWINEKMIAKDAGAELSIISDHE